MEKERLIMMGYLQSLFPLYWLRRALEFRGHSLNHRCHDNTCAVGIADFFP
jgi:hypothetical protein